MTRRFLPELPRLMVDEAVVAEVVIGIGNGDVEHDAAPQLCEIFFGVGTVLGQELGELQVTGFIVAVVIAELRHRRGEVKATLRRAIKAFGQEGVVVTAELFDPALRHDDSCVERQLVNDIFPGGHIVIILSAWKLGDP